MLGKMGKEAEYLGRIESGLAHPFAVRCDPERSPTQFEGEFTFPMEHQEFAAVPCTCRALQRPPCGGKFLLSPFRIVRAPAPGFRPRTCQASTSGVMLGFDRSPGHGGNAVVSRYSAIGRRLVRTFLAEPGEFGLLDDAICLSGHRCGVRCATFSRARKSAGRSSYLTKTQLPERPPPALATLYPPTLPTMNPIPASPSRLSDPQGPLFVIVIEIERSIPTRASVLSSSTS